MSYSTPNMFKFAVFAALLCVQAYARPSDMGFEIDPHIVGGTPATEGQFPFIVSIRQHHSGYSFCGGALLSNRYVVTAAHCVAELARYKIGAGSFELAKQKLYEVQNITVHPEFEGEKIINDIALLKLKTPVEIGGNVQTINYPVTEKLDDKNVTALGWGRTSTDGPPSSTLLYLKRPIINNQECQKRLNYKILDSQICLGSEKGMGMCFGDSGSPLLHKGTDGKNYIAGIVSWGVPCAKGYPDVFTRVSSFTDWIKKNMV